MKKIKILIIIILVLIGSILIFFKPYSSTNNDWKKDDGIVEISYLNKGLQKYIYFDGPGEDNAIIFTPGVRVDIEAYGNLLKGLSKNGYDCFIIKEPLNFCLLNINGPKTIIDNYEYDNYYLAGHSMGALTNSIYAYDNQDLISGQILLASYLYKDFSNSDTKVLSIRASEDNIINMNNFEKNINYFPTSFRELVIEGGNHSGFADYGKQKGDGDALIDSNAQKELTINFILDNLTK